MSDMSAAVVAAEQDDANLATLLLGGRPYPTDRDVGLDDFPPFNPGVLRRLIQSFAADPVPGAQQITPGAATFTLTVPDRALSAVITVETTSIRYRTDGSAPTAAVGTPVAAGQTITLTGRATLTGFIGIRTAAGSVVNVDYYS